MAAYARVSRESMYASSTAVPGSMALTIEEPGHSSGKQAKHQSEAHDRSKRSKRAPYRKWKKLNLHLESEQQPIADWGGQSAFTIPEATLEPARDATSSLDFSHRPTQTPSHLDPPSQPQPSRPHNQTPRAKKHYRKKKQPTMADDNVTRPLNSEYIPPHIRKVLPRASISTEIRSAEPAHDTSGAPTCEPLTLDTQNAHDTSGAPICEPLTLDTQNAHDTSGAPICEPLTLDTQNAHDTSGAPTCEPLTLDTQNAPKATSSSGPPTGITNGQQPKSPLSLPSSPVNEEDKTKNGTLSAGRGGSKGPMPDALGRVSFYNSAANQFQPKGVANSRSNNARQRGKGELTTKPLQATSGRNGWGEQPNWDNAASGSKAWNNTWTYEPQNVTRNKTTSGWPKKKARNAWPKSRDMKAQPVEEESEGGVSFKSNSNGDINYDVKKLLDFNGDWMPPPEVWSGRNTFQDRHFGDHIEGWMSRSEAAGCSKLIMDISSRDFTAESNSELAPREWIPIKIEDEAPQQFWCSYSSRAPNPLSDVDVTDLKPWWESYSNRTTEFLSPLQVPVARIDVSEEQNRLPGTKMTSEAAVKNKEDAHKKKIARIIAKRNGPIKKTDPAPKSPDTSLKPTRNIYLRPVQPADVPQITDLYNRYVRTTIAANEFNDRTTSNIATRLQDIMARGLPWIVAVEKGNHQQGQHFKFVNENIVGFSSMDDHCDPGSMYRYTFEMEMYVHPEYLRQGVAKCLLDRMLELVDNGYRTRGGYEWICEGDYLKYGSTRVVKTINVHYIHEHGEASEVNWVAAFLKQFGFRRSGHLYEMGHKLGKVVDISIFQKSTSEQIDPNSKPSQPL